MANGETPSGSEWPVEKPGVLEPGFQIPDTATAQRAYKEEIALLQYSARIDIPPPEGSPAVSDLKLLPVDYDALEKEASEIKEKFNDIFR